MSNKTSKTLSREKYLKISIITPSFNQSNFIEQTILSVLNQNYPNLEYFIIDGGSSDNTLNILKKYDKHIKWISEKDKGQANAINKGLTMATGEIITYLNSDDTYENKSLFIINDYFLAHKSCKWLCGTYKIVDEGGNQIQKSIVTYKNILSKLDGLNSLSIANYIPQPSTFFRKSVIEEVGNFDENLRYTMDYDYWLRLRKLYKPCIIDDCLSAFRIHSESKGGKEYKMQFDEELMVAERHVDNDFLIGLHKLHNQFIVQVYNFLKK